MALQTAVFEGRASKAQLQALLADSVELARRRLHEDRAKWRRLAKEHPERAATFARFQADETEFARGQLAIIEKTAKRHGLTS